MTQPNETCADLLGALDRGESLPARWYTDPSILEQEMLQVFRKSWNYIGPAAELTKVGDYITGYAGNVPVVVVPQRRGPRRLRQCLPPSPPPGHEGPRQRHAHAMRLPRLDLRSGGRPAARAALGSRARLPAGRLSAAADPGRGAGAVRVRQSRCETRLPAKDCYGPILDIIAKSGIDLDTLDAPQPRRLAGARQLEGDAGELPRMLPLRGRPSGLQRGDRRAARRLHPGLARLVLQPGRPRAASGARRQEPRSSSTTCAARSRSRSITSCGRTSPSTSIRASPTCRSTSGCRTARTRPAASRSSISGRASTKEFAQALIAFNKQVALEDDDLTDSVQRGLVGGLPERGRVPHQERAAGRSSSRR